MITVKDMAMKARQAARILAMADTDQKNQAILRLVKGINESSQRILQANAKDLTNAEANGLSAAMLDRLMLNPTRLMGITRDLENLIELTDPIGESYETMVLANGLRVHKQRIPLGLVGVIYESRPNVTIDVAGVAIKTGNAAILRGGTESIHTNRVLVSLVQQALASVQLPPESIMFIDDPDRQRVMDLLQLHEWIDILIPRGGAQLHRFCRENSRIPVISGGIGICHLFVDDTANIHASLPLIRNAKIQRPTVCNALDTILVHQSIAETFIPQLVGYLEADGVEFRVDKDVLPFLNNKPDLMTRIRLAGEADFDTEWLSLVLGVKVVASIDEAIDHILAHSTSHSDGILTETEEHARLFIKNVDSSTVYVNASTRFTDGAQLGLGTEVAVSTQRLHARGPMGLREMTTYKWVVEGDYHIRGN